MMIIIIFDFLKTHNSDYNDDNNNDVPQPWAISLPLMSSCGAWSTFTLCDSGQGSVITITYSSTQSGKRLEVEVCPLSL